jgi:hypothetical protein
VEELGYSHYGQVAPSVWAAGPCDVKGHCVAGCAYLQITSSILFHVLFCRQDGSSSLQTILALLSDTFVPINQTIRHHNSEHRNGHDSLTVHPEKGRVITAIIRKVGFRILALMNAVILHNS